MRDEDLSSIASALKSQGISLERGSVRKHSSQGLMNEVYAADSSRGPLIIHLLSPSKEAMYQKTFEKIQAISRALAEYKEVPHVLASGPLGQTYFLVQEMLPGTPSGSRAVQDGKVLDTRLEPEVIVPRLQELLARVHATPVSGYGWIESNGSALVGSHANWNSFLSHESDRWIAAIDRADAGVREPITQALRQYLDATLPRIAYEGSSLVHGDATNPTNVLIQNGRITGLLDWEWALAGDPAWEFCSFGGEELLGNPPLEAYARAVGLSDEARQAVIRRAAMYHPFYLMWAASTHAEHPHGVLYLLTRNLLEKEILKDIL